MTIPALISQQDTQHIALITLVFPDSLATSSPRDAPVDDVFAKGDGSVQLLPSTGNPLHSISQDTALAFSSPYDEASTFLARIQELPIQQNSKQPVDNGADIPRESTRWIMKAASDHERLVKPTIRSFARKAWIGFVDIVKVRTLQTH